MLCSSVATLDVGEVFPVGLSIKYLTMCDATGVVLKFQRLLDVPLSDLSQINMEVSALDR